MLIAISALKGYAVEATDGPIGKVSDFLLDDLTWKIRWLVVDAGTWLTERKVLVHPSSLGKPDYDGESLPILLTKETIKGGPTLAEHEPVSSQIEQRLYGYYGSDPFWGESYFGGGALAAPMLMQGDSAMGFSLVDDDPGAGGDPHLRSIAEIKDYRILATDGEIGHVENFLIDDGHWDVRYLIVDTRNWWPGKHVLISPYAVQAVSWSDGAIRLDVDREHVKSSPPWDPITMIDKVYEKKLHSHYGWRGYGF